MLGGRERGAVPWGGAQRQQELACPRHRLQKFTCDPVDWQPSG